MTNGDRPQSSFSYDNKNDDDDSREEEVYDVIVVGGGNAGFSAASTAAQSLRSLRSSDSSDTTAARQPRVLLIEKAPQASCGGNTFYTAGAYRFCFDGLSDLRPILSYDNGQNNDNGIPDSLAERIEMAPYTAADFHADLDRVTSGRADKKLAEILVGRSREAVDWMARNGGKWELSFHRQAYEVEGKFKFWGGLVVCFADGGKGLVRWHEELAHREGVEVWYDTMVTNLITTTRKREDGRTMTSVTGVEVLDNNNGQDNDGCHRHRRIYARGGVILATGGFQANPSLRSQWLGPSWTNAHVRGSATNTGDGHAMTLLSSSRRISAKPAGHYTGCHSVCWDAASPAGGGDRILTNQYTKSGYPLGIMVNAAGERFVDEGADLRNYTYAIFGREVLKQPFGGIAWQIWDADGAALLRKEEYDASVTDLVVADTLEELAHKLSLPPDKHADSGVSGLQNPTKLLETIRQFNDACIAFQQQNLHVVFDPARRDGLSTRNNSSGTSLDNVNELRPPKSNWARPLTTPPFTAVKVTCGITFTFGGLAVVPDTAEVIAADADADADDGDDGNGNGNGNDDTVIIKGLYAIGELMGGLFWDNYPGGSGLTAGTVWGRIAGMHAARRSLD